MVKIIILVGSEAFKGIALLDSSLCYIFVVSKILSEIYEDMRVNPTFSQSDSCLRLLMPLCLIFSI